MLVKMSQEKLKEMYVKSSFKNICFQMFFLMSIVLLVLMLHGMVFHSRGAATAKVLSYAFSRAFGVARSF